MKIIPKHTRAFTLIELLTVIAIIGVLAGILVPVVGRVRETARSAQCVSNLRQLASAARLWIDDNKGAMLDARLWCDGNTSNSTKTPYHINPYLTGTQKTVKNQPSPWKCESTFNKIPSDSDFGRTYSINTFASATLDGTRRTSGYGYAYRIEQIQVPSRMAFFMDGGVSQSDTPVGYASNVSAGNVPDNATQPLHYNHNDGINIAFIDGHVARVTKAEMQTHHTDSGSESSDLFWHIPVN